MKYDFNLKFEKKKLIRTLVTDRLIDMKYF